MKRVIRFDILQKGTHCISKVTEAQVRGHYAIVPKLMVSFFALMVTLKEKDANFDNIIHAM